jgi:predicted membrane-bound spermidine synthase
MGLSLPLLSRVVSDDLDLSAERIGGLYGWNTLGAAVGALVTVWLLVRLLGFEGAIRVGAAVNALCAVGAVAVARLGSGGGEAPSPPEAASRPAIRVEPPEPVRLALGSWLSLYALSGFVALSLEILWFRILGIVLKSNSFTFATLLAIYLAGLGAGALLGARLARGSRRPAAAFCGLQASIGLYAGLSMAVLTFGLGHFGFLDLLRSYLAEEEALKLGEAVPATVRYLLRGGHVAPYARHLTHVFLTLYGVLPLVLFGPGTLLMGMSFPFLQKAVQTDLVRLGRRVGWLQAANILGSTLGAALTGLGLLHWLGTAWTLRLLVALAGVFLLLFVRLRFSGRRGRASASLAAVTAVLLAASVSPGPETLWSRLHGTTADRVLFVEDGSGLSLLKDLAPENGRPATAFHVHGLGQSHLPFGSYHTVLGALPVLIHPRPVDVAVIGLGSGDTVFGIAGRAETERIDCIEIVRSELEALKKRAARPDFPGLERLFRDGRVRYFFTDGRTFLMRGKGRYDVIEADALWPDSAYSGNLYSLEYFGVLRGRLKPGGYAVTWSPTTRVRDTFVRVFPHVLQVGSTLIGSDSPIALDPESVRARMKERFPAAHYALGDVDIEALVSDALAHPQEVWTPGSDRTALTDVNTDLFPKDEYLVSFKLWPR